MVQPLLVLAIVSFAFALVLVERCAAAEPGTDAYALARIGVLLTRLAQRDDPEARRELVARTAALGAHGKALALARTAPTELDPTLRERLQQDAVAQQIRHGTVARDVVASDPAAIAARHALLDAVIATSRVPARRLSGRAPDAAEQRRIGYDLIAALVERQQFAEALRRFDALDGPDVPDYVLAAAGEAALALRRPKRAQALMLRAIAGRRSPATWAWRTTVAQAQRELGRPNAARATLARLDEDVQAAWRRAAHPVRREAAARARDALRITRYGAAGAAYQRAEAAGRLDEAEEALPFDLDVRSARIGEHLAESRPRAAWAEARRLRIDQPDSLWPRVLEIQTLSALGDHRAARRHLEAFRELDVEAAQTARLAIGLRRDAAGLVRTGIDVARSDAPPGGVNPIHERTQALAIESRRFDDRWRLLGGVRTTIADLDVGRSVRSRVEAGVRLEGRLTEAAMLLSADRDGARRGAQVALRHSPADPWWFGLRWTHDSDDLPGRAGQAGIRLSTLALDARLQPLPGRRFEGLYEAGRFSDGNHRQFAAGTWTEVWHETPRRQLWTRLSASHGWFGSGDFVYFSPAGYSTVAAALVIEAHLLRRYETEWRHRLTLEPTWNRQQGAGTGRGANLRYEWLAVVDARWGGRAGLEHVRRPYDGIGEGRTRMFGELFLRF